MLFAACYHGKDGGNVASLNTCLDIAWVPLALHQTQPGEKIHLLPGRASPKEGQLRSLERLYSHSNVDGSGRGILEQ